MTTDSDRERLARTLWSADKFVHTNPTVIPDKYYTLADVVIADGWKRQTAPPMDAEYHRWHLAAGGGSMPSCGVCQEERS